LVCKDSQTALQCRTGYSLIDGQCRPCQIDNGFYQIDGRCRKCHDSC
jgi:hypothetical protein